MSPESADLASVLSPLLHPGSQSSDIMDIGNVQGLSTEEALSRLYSEITQALKDCQVTGSGKLVTALNH